MMVDNGRHERDLVKSETMKPAYLTMLRQRTNETKELTM